MILLLRYKCICVLCNENANENEKHGSARRGGALPSSGIGPSHCCNRQQMGEKASVVMARQELLMGLERGQTSQTRKG